MLLLILAAIKNRDLYDLNLNTSNVTVNLKIKK